jgi:hypothetical protein
LLYSALIDGGIPITYVRIAATAIPNMIQFRIIMIMRINAGSVYLNSFEYCGYKYLFTLSENNKR